MHELDIGFKRTVVDWKHFCRDIRVEYHIRSPIKVGGWFAFSFEKNDYILDRTRTYRRHR